MLIGALCAFMAAYAILRYQVASWMGAVTLHDRWSRSASEACAITWSDSAMPLCNERLAMWLYHKGLRTDNERRFIAWKVDYFFPRAVGRLERCDHLHIVHIGNRGTTLGLDDGSDYYIAPPTRDQHWLDPETNMRKYGWHDGGDVLVCAYQNKYAYRYGIYKVDGEEAVPRRGRPVARGSSK